MTDRTEFLVEDMTCGHCEKAIRSALAEALPGADVGVDLAGHTVTVAVTVAGDAAKAEQAITEAGYTPKRKAA